jgi:hypothetical protein
LHIQRPFFLSPFASLPCGGGCSFPSPMPTERWRNPPAQLQARPNQEPESKNQSPIGRGPQSPSPRTGPICFGSESPGLQRRVRLALDPRARVQGRVRLLLDLGVRWTPESDPKNGLCALPCCSPSCRRHSGSHSCTCRQGSRTCRRGSWCSSKLR